MIRVALIVLLLASAFSLVTSQQRARRAFVDLERAHAQERQLEQDWSQLQLAQTEAAKHALVEQVARQQLGMRPVTPDRTQYIEVVPAASGEAP